MTASPPRPYDPSRAARTLDALAAEGVALEPTFKTLIESASGNSPFLARLILRERAMLGEPPDAAVEAARMLALSAGAAETEADAMARLRIAKRRAALAIALADIAGVWDRRSRSRAR